MFGFSKRRMKLGRVKKVQLSDSSPGIRSPIRPPKRIISNNNANSEGVALPASNSDDLDYHCSSSAPPVISSSTAGNNAENWMVLSISGDKPTPRFNHAATVIGNKMIVVGGESGSGLLDDVQVLKFDQFTWTSISSKLYLSPSSLPLKIPACRGHCLVSWGKKALLIGGKTDPASDRISVWAFDTETECWSLVEAKGDIPIARNGHTVVRASSVLILFGGEDAKRKKLNDLHMFDLKSFTWLPLHCTGTGPSPRSNHVAALYDDKNLLIFGGTSKSRTLNDLYSLDFETMVWSRTKIRGFHPSPRAGCCGVLCGTKWYIAGGGSRKKRHSETLIYDILKMEWSVAFASPPSSITTNKGFSLVLVQHKEKDFLVAFGGSKKEPSNQVEVMGIEKNESSTGRHSAPSKGPGRLLFEKRSSSTVLAAQLGTGSSQRSADSVARQNLASAIEQHGSGRKSLSDSLLVDPNSASRNVSHRKEFHHEEENRIAVKTARNLEDDNSSSPAAEHRSNHSDISIQLALRREGRLDEADEELKKGKVLEQQLEEMENASIVKEKQALGGVKNPDLEYEHHVISGGPLIREEEEDVTDQDMHDPAYLSLLSNLGWKDDDDEHPNSSFNPPKENDSTNLLVTHSTYNISMKIPRRSKAEIQRELIGLKRKALTLRREGKTNEAEEVLTAAKSLEAEMEEMETPKKDIQTESSRLKDKIIRPVISAADEGDMDDITEKDMHDPSLNSMLTNLGWKDDEDEAVTTQAKPSKQVSDSSVNSTNPSSIPFSSSISAARKRSKGEIQRELLGLKRKALALRRKGETEEAEELLKMANVLESQMEELEGPKELLIDDSEDKKPQSSGSLINHEKQNNVKIALGTSEKFASAAGDPNEKVVESFVCSGRKESDTVAPLLRSPDIVNSVSFELNKGKHPSVGQLDLMGEIRSLSNSGINHGNDFIPPAHQSVNVMDLLTGDDWNSPQIPAGKLEDKVNFGSDASCLPEHHVHVGSSGSHTVRGKDEEISSVSDISLSSEPHGHVHAPKNFGSKENARTELSEETVNVGKKPHVDETDSVQGLVSQNNKISLQQEVLARKRKAVALKREGKLGEAREELRQAKLLEKSLEVETPGPVGSSHDGSTSASNAPSAQQKDPSAPNLAPKPLSGRDRFKLQQESLSHKRQALKMRREGRVEEAEAEFELAKALEAQLDEMSSANIAEPVDDVVVEDLLDPQLLSALKAIGIEDTSTISQGSERPGPVKVSPTKSESNSQERIQLEERIKAEKVKAVNLKRAGKQAEALDALRRSKLFEKKLNSLA